MKNRLFGRLGQKLKGNMLTLFLVGAIGFGALYTYNTIKNINQRLENQHLQDIETTPRPTPQQEVQDVQQQQNNVPLPPVATPTPPVQHTQTEEQRRPRQPPQKKFILPVDGKIFARFSGDELVYNRTLDDWRTHNGIDISARPGDRVKAGADGLVKQVYDDGMLGTVVEIDHNGFTARYCGLAPSAFVKAGDSVTQGQSVGTVGETAMEISEESHIHLEIIRGGVAVNPDTLLK